MQIFIIYLKKGDAIPQNSWGVIALLKLTYSLLGAGANVAFFKLPNIEQQFILVFFADFVHFNERETTEKKEKNGRKEGRKKGKEKNEKITKKANK